MKKVKKHFWKALKKAGVPFGLRVLLVKHAVKGTPAVSVAQFLRGKGIPVVLGGKAYCPNCGFHFSYLALRWKNYRVTFPVTCTGICWLSPKVKKCQKSTTKGVI